MPGGSVSLPGSTARFDTSAVANSLAQRDSSGGLTANVGTFTQLVCSGKVTFAWVAKSGSYAISASGDCTIETTGSITLTLPAPATVAAGTIIRIVKSDTATTVTVNPNAAETINGAASKTISTQYTIAEFWTNGTNWYAGSHTVL